MTRIPLTGRSAPPRSRLARALAATVVALALSASAAVGAEAVADQQAVTDQAVAVPAPTPVGSPTSPEPTTEPATDPLADPATPVSEAPTTPVVVDPTAPDPVADGGTAPAPPAPADPTAPVQPIVTPPTPIDVPAQGPDAAPGTGTTTPAGASSASLPATPPAATPATAPDPVVIPDRLPVAARDAADLPAATPDRRPVAPAAERPKDALPTVELLPQFVTASGDTALRQAADAPPIPPAVKRIQEAVKESARATSLQVSLHIPLTVTAPDERGSILQLLAGYVFPGAASNNSGAIILLFSVALLIAMVTPRIPRLHLATLVAERGAGCPGYNPVALRPG